MRNITFIKQRPILSFFVLSYLISWVLWIPLIYGHFKFGWTSWEGNIWNDYKPWLGILGALGPALAAIIMANITDGTVGVKTLFRRVVQWRVNIKWWMVAFYGWWLLATIIALLLNLKPLRNIALQFGLSLINIPGLIFTLQLPFIIGIFGEELGWRGYALPKLLNKFNPIVASLILGIPWLFWHAPLAFFEDWRSGMPIGEFLYNYILLVVPLTLIFTWFFQKTKGSVLLVIVFHRAFNLTFNGISQAIGLDEKQTGALMDNLIVGLWVIAGIIVIYYLFQKPKTQIS